MDCTCSARDANKVLLVRPTEQLLWDFHSWPCNMDPKSYDIVRQRLHIRLSLSQENIAEQTVIAELADPPCPPWRLQRSHARVLEHLAKDIPSNVPRTTNIADMPVSSDLDIPGTPSMKDLRAAAAAPSVSPVPTSFAESAMVRIARWVWACCSSHPMLRFWESFTVMQFAWYMVHQPGHLMGCAFPNDYCYCNACGVIGHWASDERSAPMHAGGVSTGCCTWRQWVQVMEAGQVGDRMTASAYSKEHVRSLRWCRHMWQGLLEDEGCVNHVLYIVLHLVGFCMTFGADARSTLNDTSTIEGKVDKVLAWWKGAIASVNAVVARQRSQRTAASHAEIRPAVDRAEPVIGCALHEQLPLLPPSFLGTTEKPAIARRSAPSPQCQMLGS